jgi:tetratricopeptide (TPR) repeat protein
MQGLGALAKKDFAPRAAAQFADCSRARAPAILPAMRNLIRGIVVLALLWLEVILYMHVKVLQKLPPEEVDGTKIMVMFLAITFVAIIIGTIFAVTVIPAIGEAVGGFFFSPNVEVEKGPHADAIAKVAQGDFEGAIEEYHRVFESNPADTHCVSEIVHIYCDKLNSPEIAEEYLNNTLQQEWPQEQAAFFANRLADIYWNHKHDAASARHILSQIAETMPETRYAANALHRMHELDRAVANEEAGIKLHTPQKQDGEEG